MANQCSGHSFSIVQATNGNILTWRCSDCNSGPFVAIWRCKICGHCRCNACHTAKAWEPRLANELRPGLAWPGLAWHGVRVWNTEYCYIKHLFVTCLVYAWCTLLGSLLSCLFYIFFLPFYYYLGKSVVVCFHAVLVGSLVELTYINTDMFCVLAWYLPVHGGFRVLRVFTFGTGLSLLLACLFVYLSVCRALLEKLASRLGYIMLGVKRGTESFLSYLCCCCLALPCLSVFFFFFFLRTNTCSCSSKLTVVCFALRTKVAVLEFGILCFRDWIGLDWSTAHTHTYTHTLAMKNVILITIIIIIIMAFSSTNKHEGHGTLQLRTTNYRCN